MLVYGDRSERHAPYTVLQGLRDTLTRIEVEPEGIRRHGELVDAFIQASGLAQGVADAAFAAAEVDCRTPAGDAALALLMQLARAVMASWNSGFAASCDSWASALDALAAIGLPDTVTTRTAEGYAYYALYPEAYGRAAAVSGLGGNTKVIGLRSIGAGLAAMVAAVLGADAPATLRPVGHPFRRELSLSPELCAELLANRSAAFAIVDEGPGLSGSSLGAVADFLEDNGVAAERIVFFPGHGGDLGFQAAPRHRARWGKAQRHVVTFEALWLDAAVPAHFLPNAFADLIGPAIAAPENLSGGAWRSLRYPEELDWPPSNSFQERRKLRVKTASGTWLLKFVGLGAPGRRAFHRARALAQAGFSPQVLGLRHGFTVERWISGATLRCKQGGAENASVVLPSPAKRRRGTAPNLLRGGAGGGLATLLQISPPSPRSAWSPPPASQGENKAQVSTQVGVVDVDRDVLVRRLGEYLAFRTSQFPAGPESGASLGALLEMTEVNVAEALGPAAGQRVSDTWRSRVGEIQPFVRRVETDNRLHVWEWLVTDAGALLKTDAVDHAHAHDLIGCQDIAWDLAGAAIEFDLSTDEQTRLASIVADQCAREKPLELRELHILCYVAFQLGAYTMASEAHGGSLREQALLRGRCTAYRHRLEGILDSA